MAIYRRAARLQPTTTVQATTTRSHAKAPHAFTTAEPVVLAAPFDVPADDAAPGLADDVAQDTPPPPADDDADAAPKRTRKPKADADEGG